MDYQTIMADKVDVNIVESETCDSVSAKRKHFLGVSKSGNKWRARIQHPKLEVKVNLGCYSTPEEAALVVKKKNAEFQETLEGEGGLRKKRRWHEFEGRKLPCGVTREYGKFRVRIWHPVLKRAFSFGAYSTCEEAAFVADRKRGELWELYGGKPRGNSECEDDDKVLQECADEQTSDIKVPAGVRRERSGKRVARIKDPVSSDIIWLGTYDTPEEAIRCYNKEKDVLDTKMKRAEFEEFKGKEDVNIVENETCDVVSAKRKHLFGVSRKGNKWQARIRHPKLKVTVHLGYYSTPEEAALVVKLKKAEFEETLKGVDGLWEQRRRHEFEGRKLPCGVRREYGKFRVRIWHPVLKRDAYFGAYSTCEEAAVIADRKRAELRELYGGRPRCSSVCEDNDKVLQETGSETEKTADFGKVYGGKVRGSSECEDDDEILQEIESEVAGKFEYTNEQTSDIKAPGGVRRVKSVKQIARVKDPVSRARLWLGTYDTAEEAIRSYDKKVAVQMGYDGLNNFEIGDRLNCGLVDVPDQLECQFVQGSPTSNIEPGTANSACVSDKRVIDKMCQRKTTCSLEFDEAVSTGFINEYGQLMGKYRELDEQLWLGLPD